MHQHNDEHHKHEKEQSSRLLLTVGGIAIAVLCLLTFLSSSVSKQLLGIQINPLAGFASFSTGSKDGLVVNCVKAPCPWDPNSGPGTNGGTNNGPQFVVTSPGPKDVWVPGETYKIVWQPPVMDPSFVAYKVSIMLQKPLPDCVLYSKPPCEVKQIAPYVITSSAENSGVYAWTIPADLASAYTGNVQIIVKINDTDLEAHSGTFQINKAGDTTVGQVSSPASGDHWKLGSSHKIVWDLVEKQVSNETKLNRVNITLSPVNNCTPPNCSEIAYFPPLTIASNVANTGVYVWKVPAKLEDGYFGPQQITVSIQNTDQSVTSSIFYIDGPSVTGSKPQITNSTMPAAQMGRAYTLQFAATGGQAPYRWAVAVSNNITGWVIDESKGIFKANIRSRGNYTVVTTVTDANGNSSMKRFSWRVN